MPALMAVSPARGRLAGASLAFKSFRSIDLWKNLILNPVPFPYANSGVSIALIIRGIARSRCLPWPIAWIFFWQRT